MAFCSNCGSAAEGRFCPKCGAAIGAGAPTSGPGAPPPPGPPPAGPPPPGYNPAPGYSAPGAYAPPAAAAGMTDNMAGALCYLFGFITGILFLVLAPYNQNRNIKFHAFQSIFLNIGWVVLWIGLAIISIALHVIPILGTIIMIALQFVVGIGAFI